MPKGLLASEHRARPQSKLVLFDDQFSGCQRKLLEVLPVTLFGCPLAFDFISFGPTRSASGLLLPLHSLFTLHLVTHRFIFLCSHLQTDIPILWVFLFFFTRFGLYLKRRRGSYGWEWRMRRNWNCPFTFCLLFIISEQNHSPIRPSGEVQEHRLRPQTSWGFVLTLPCISSVTLDKLFSLSDLSVLICKMKITIV